ncbi:hypothetical protein HDV00_002097, partial [Rhizophlyctis rosea]
SSGYALGGWIAQPADPGEEIPSVLPKTLKGWKEMPKLKPIVFWARKMIPAETRYPVHEQELLAL